MIVVFRCSARNWLLFVVAPPAVFMVCVCVSLCVYMCIYKCMCLRALHAGLCVYVCVEVRIFFVPPQMCQCSVWSPAQLFHVIVPPTVCALPASRLISVPPPPPLSRQPPLSSPCFPLASLFLTLRLSLFHCATFFNHITPLSLHSVPPQHQWGHQIVNCTSCFKTF